MAAGGHIGCPKTAFDHSSCHIRSIRNFFCFEIFGQNGRHRPFWTARRCQLSNSSEICWMNNVCLKFEERSLNPSKVIALTTKLCGGRRRRRCGGCVAVENIIFPKTYVSREYNNVYICTCMCRICI